MFLSIRRRFVLLCLVLAAGVSAAAAQTPARTQEIPLDPSIKTGRFANGLRYFIRTTKKPEKRAELRLVVDVGSIVEDETQLGLAHFLEHMAFNGTKHFPKQETVAFLESLGMRFGPSINAYTSFDETVYMLQVPTEKPDVLDRAFLILEDWAHGQTLDPAEIDKERGVIREEWRVRRGAGARINDKQLPVMLKGSRYAERLPIGTMEVIDTFKHERLIQFYKDWYRPDLMTVIAVGDFDPAAVEQMIKAHFEPIPAATNPRPRGTFTVPDTPGTLFTIATDAEMTNANITVYGKLPARSQRTVGDYRRDIVERLFAGMLGARFAELSQKPDAPFVGAGGSRGAFIGDKDVSTLGALVKGDAIAQTLDVLFTEAERVARFGFTAGELDRAKANVMTGIDRALKEKDNAPAGSIANELVRHVTTGEPVPGIEYEHGLFQQFLPEITLAEVNALAMAWVPDGNRVIAIAAPEKEGFKVPTEEQLVEVLASVAARKDITAYVDTVDAAPLLDPLPSPGTIVSEKKLDTFGITEWKLSNGVTVVLKPTDFRDDEILFRATSYGGTSLAPDADYVPASSASSVVAAGGIGHLSAIELRKRMTGITAAASASIGPHNETLSGASSKKDLETMFQLIHLRFTQPREDAQAFAAMQSQMKSMLQLQRANPSFLFNEALTEALYGGHPRTKPLTAESAAQMDLAKSMAFYKDRFADAGDFTFVFAGSFDVAQMRPLVERYLASLPSTGRKESWKDTGIRYQKGTITKRIEKGLEPQSRASIVFTGPFEYTPQQRAVIRLLSDVVTTRLHEILREALGGTYGVSADAGYSDLPVSEYSIRITFASAPDRTEELIAAAMTDIEKLKTEGPTEKQVNDAREKLIRDYETDSKTNSFWTTQLSFRYQRGDTVDGLFEQVELYKAITPGAVQAAAKTYFNPANVVTVTLFPEKK